jgi:hypothetical protein
LLRDAKMQTLSRFIAIMMVGSSFIAFTAMKVGAVDMPGIVPPPFPAPGIPGFPAPAQPKPMPNFPGAGGSGNAPGGTGNAPGVAPSGGTGGTLWGGTGGMSGPGIP